MKVAHVAISMYRCKVCQKIDASVTGGGSCDKCKAAAVKMAQSTKPLAKPVEASYTLVTFDMVCSNGNCCHVGNVARLYDGTARLACVKCDSEALTGKASYAIGKTKRGPRHPERKPGSVDNVKKPVIRVNVASGYDHSNGGYPTRTMTYRAPSTEYIQPKRDPRPAGAIGGAWETLTKSPPSPVPSPVVKRKATWSDKGTDLRKGDRPIAGYKGNPYVPPTK